MSNIEDIGTPVKLYETAFGLPPQTAYPVEGPLNGLSVCFQAADEAGCGGYRCILPAGQMRKYGAKVKWCRKITSRDYDEYNIFVFQRPMEAGIAHEMKEISRLGKMVLVEVDDNLHQVSPYSPVFETYKISKLGPFTDALKAADGLIVSTPEIAKAYYKYNKNIVIAPNSIDINLGYRDWSGVGPSIEKKDGEVVLLWRGGLTHQQDLALMKNTITRVMAKYDNVRLALYTGLELSEWAIKIWNLEKYKDRITFIEPRKFVEYPKGLFGADIMLVPLVNSEFNESKSELALCEAGALKIPVVCSPSAAYTRFAGLNNQFAITNGIHKEEIPLEVTTPLDELIENESKRKELGERAYQRVLENYNLETTIHNWLSAFKIILEQKQGVSTPNTKQVYRTGKEDPCYKCLEVGVKKPGKFKKCKKHYGVKVV